MNTRRNRLRFFFGVITALLLLLIFSRSAKTASESSAESTWVLELVKRLIPGVGMKLIRKLAHFTEYFILGVLLWLDCCLLQKSRWILPLGVGLAVASADEFFQTFIPGRSGQLTDVLIDGSGVLFAVALLYLLAWARRRKKAARTQKTACEAAASGTVDRPQ